MLYSTGDSRQTWPSCNAEITDDTTKDTPNCWSAANRRKDPLLLEEGKHNFCFVPCGFQFNVRFQWSAGHPVSFLYLTPQNPTFSFSSTLWISLPPWSFSPCLISPFHAVSTVKNNSFGALNLLPLLTTALKPWGLSVFVLFSGRW